MKKAWRKFWLRRTVRAAAFFGPSACGDDFGRNMLTAHVEVRIGRELIDELVSGDGKEALVEVLSDQARERMEALVRHTSRDTLKAVL